LLLRCSIVVSPSFLLPMTDPSAHAIDAPSGRSAPPTTSLAFLEIAKRCEIAELEHLAVTAELVSIVGRLTHGLQRERGLGNLYLGSARQRHGVERDAQILECDRLEAALHAWFDRIDRAPGAQRGSARLYSRIAYVLQGLDALPRLRDAVTRGAWQTARATAAYARIIAALLSLVFEAADSATDPEVSRLLVAMFNFSQGKEFAGLERAIGAAMFASGRFTADDQLRLVHLIESQERCLAICEDFASAGQRAFLRLNEAPETVAELERLRRVLLGAAGDPPSQRDRGQAWFACCSRRLDEMRRVEDLFAEQLRILCRNRIEAARAELATYESYVRQGGDGVPGVSPAGPAPSGASADPPSRVEAVPFFDDPEIPDLPPSIEPADRPRVLGPRLERSVLDLVREQSQRLQAMRAELDAVRAALNERKVVERAKGLLMAHRQLSEDEAHKTLRQMAMNQNRRLVDVAEAVLAMADILPAPNLRRASSSTGGGRH
jgi:hypothetical protein